MKLFEPPKTFNCPFCKKEDAVRMIEKSNGNYDFSHAQSCPELVDVLDKERLMIYHLPVEKFILSDDLSFEDYQELLKPLGFSIFVETNRKDEMGEDKKVWSHTMFIDSIIVPGSRCLETEAETPDNAFECLKYRLMCGEVLKHGNLRFQRREIEQKVVFKNL